MELMMKDELRNAAIAEFQAQRMKARANMLVYFSSPMAIGDHSNIVEEVVNLTRQIAEAEECIDVLERLR